MSLTQTASAQVALYQQLAQGMNGNTIIIFKGTKTFNKGEWSPIDRQPELGLKSYFKGFAFDMLYASDKGTTPAKDVKGSTLETHLGIRTDVTGSSNYSLFVGGGYSLTQASLQFISASSSSSASDSASGWWGEVGLKFTFQTLMFGVDYIESSGTGSLFGRHYKLGGKHTGVFLGVRF
jgi:hypothetical protein